MVTYAHAPVMFQDLALSPELTTASALFIAVLLVGLLFANLRLRMITPLICWFFALLMLITTILFEVQFIYFWIAILLNGASMIIGMVVWLAYGTRI